MIALSVLLQSELCITIHPQDPSNLARIIRLPAFLGHTADERDSDFSRKVAAEWRKLSTEAQITSHQQTVQRIQGETVLEEDPQRDLKQVNMEWVLDVKSRFQDRLIRQDLNSLRWDGARINESLPPKRIIAATCRLDEKEMKMLDRGLDKLNEDLKST